VPSKKAEGNKSPATTASASRARTLATATVAEVETKPIRTGAKSIQRKSRAAKSDAATAGGSSILNLATAVNGHITPEQVAERAYFHWIERGCPAGTAEEDWFHAEQELGVGQ
jgi:DUF2934 family protein